MSLNLRFQIVPASLPADLDAMIEINYFAFAEHNPLMLAFFPTVPDVDRRAELIKWSKSLMEEETRGRDRHRTIYMKVVDTARRDNGEKSTIVAYSAWRAPDSRAQILSTNKDENEEATATKDEADIFFPTGADKAAFDLRRLNMKAKREEAFGEGWETKNWYLSNLATHPAYQGQGIGTRLVRWGLEQAKADAKMRPHEVEGACTVATPAGLAIYKKCGMVEVAEYVHDIGQGIGANGYKDVFLVKKLGHMAS